MRQNFGRDKRRIEETKKKRREEKKNRKLNRAPEMPAAPTDGQTQPEITSAPETA